MFDNVLSTTRDAAVILLAVEAIALSAVTLVLLLAVLKFWRQTRPKAKAGIHQAAQFVLKYSERTRQTAQQVTNVTGWVASAPAGVRKGVRTILRSRPKEAPRV
ncbi:MAG: hypothetical protein ACYC6L_06895 [Anaerolineae bacterium]